MTDQPTPNHSPSWQYIPPNSGPLPPNTKVVTTTHTGEAMDDTVNRLRIWADGMEKQTNVVVSVLMTEAADEIERLRKERDEARMDICELIAYNGRTPEDMARERGWDCFKEDTE